MFPTRPPDDTVMNGGSLMGHTCGYEGCERINLGGGPFCTTHSHPGNPPDSWPPGPPAGVVNRPGCQELNENTLENRTRVNSPPVFVNSFRPINAPRRSSDNGFRPDNEDSGEPARPKSGKSLNAKSTMRKSALPDWRANAAATVGQSITAAPMPSNGINGRADNAPFATAEPPLKKQKVRGSPVDPNCSRAAHNGPSSHSNFSSQGHSAVERQPQLPPQPTRRDDGRGFPRQPEESIHLPQLRTLSEDTLAPISRASGPPNTKGADMNGRHPLPPQLPGFKEQISRLHRASAGEAPLRLAAEAHPTRPAFPAPTFHPRSPLSPKHSDAVFVPETSGSTSAPVYPPNHVTARNPFHRPTELAGQPLQKELPPFLRQPLTSSNQLARSQSFDTADKMRDQRPFRSTDANGGSHGWQAQNQRTPLPQPSSSSMAAAPRSSHIDAGMHNPFANSIEPSTVPSQLPAHHMNVPEDPLPTMRAPSQPCNAQTPPAVGIHTSEPHRYSSPWFDRWREQNTSHWVSKSGGRGREYHTASPAGHTATLSGSRGKYSRSDTRPNGGWAPYSPARQAVFEVIDLTQDEPDPPPAHPTTAADKLTTTQTKNPNQVLPQSDILPTFQRGKSVNKAVARTIDPSYAPPLPAVSSPYQWQNESAIAQSQDEAQNGTSKEIGPIVRLGSILHGSGQIQSQRPQPAGPVPEYDDALGVDGSTGTVAYHTAIPTPDENMTPGGQKRGSSSAIDVNTSFLMGMENASQEPRITMADEEIIDHERLMGRESYSTKEKTPTPVDTSELSVQQRREALRRATFRPHGVDKLDAYIYGPANEMNGPKARKCNVPAHTVSSGPIRPATHWGYYDPRVHWTWERPREWYENKMQELARRGNRKSRGRFGRGALSYARRLSQDREAPAPLPERVRRNPAWAAAVEELRQIEEEYRKKQRNEVRRNSQEQGGHHGANKTMGSNVNESDDDDVNDYEVMTEGVWRTISRRADSAEHRNR